MDLHVKALVNGGFIKPPLFEKLSASLRSALPSTSRRIRSTSPFSSPPSSHTPSSPAHFHNRPALCYQPTSTNSNIFCNITRPLHCCTHLSSRLYPPNPGPSAVACGQNRPQQDKRCSGTAPIGRFLSSTSSPPGARTGWERGEVVRNFIILLTG